MKILVATTNKGKLKEIEQILEKNEIISLDDIENIIDVEEDKETFEENALKKAREIYKITKIPTISDDSGICIKEYNGWPGVKTARFLGEDKSTNEYSRERNNYIINKMKGLPKEKRKVEYITIVAYKDENKEEIGIGRIEGYIANAPRGENGFGFDEIFELENGKTLAELTNDEKNKISSRKIALQELKQKIIK